MSEIEKTSQPADMLLFIQSCVRDRRVHWTYHANMRLAHRSVTRHAILDAVDLPPTGPSRTSGTAMRGRGGSHCEVHYMCGINESRRQ